MPVPLTKRQVEAKSRLRMAIIEHAEAFAQIEGEHFLGDFALVCFWVREDGNALRYTVDFADENTPPHKGKGLLNEGLEVVAFGDEEED